MNERWISTLCRVVAILCCLAPGSAPAQEHQAEGQAEHEEHFHRNEAAFLLGATYEAEAGDTLFTVGGEYARRLTPRVGVAAAFEHLSDVGAWVFVFPVGVRVYRGLTLTAAPGFEHTSRRSEGGHEADEPGESSPEGAESNEGADNLFLFRIGAAYVFELKKRYSIAPGVAYDWVNEERGTATAIVYGVKFGIGF
jgi:hypothetical protein